MALQRGLDGRLSDADLKVSFRTEANMTIGMGHLVRCCSLASALFRLVKCTCFFEPPLLGHARTILAAAGETSYLRSTSEQAHFDIKVIDIPNEARSREHHMKPGSHLHVWIEDEPRHHAAQDVVIQPNLLPCSERARSSAFYSGRDFLILHPAYQHCHASVPGKRVKRVLLCFGGSDPANLSLRVARLLHSTECKVEYRLALGPFYPNTDALRHSVDPMYDLTILTGLYTLAEEMSRCDLAILSGGTLLYEACAMGRPAIILSQNESQAQEASIFARHGAVFHLGHHDLVADTDIQQSIRLLCLDGGKRSQQAAAASQMVLRDGASNVARRILSHYNM